MKIKKGDRGGEVVDIQHRLSILGYDIGPTHVDGAFEEKTEKAVKMFQQSRGLMSSGVVDQKTWRALVDASFRIGDRGLYLRSPFFHGNDVFQLQRWLNILGFHTEAVDGIFGPSTELSVRDFQENIGLFPDGIVGPSTVKALYSLSHILDKDSESVFPEMSQNSFFSHIMGKKIGIKCGGQRGENWWEWPAEGSWAHIDLAYRFSNLLELLGADIVIIHDEDVNGDDIEVLIAFESTNDLSARHRIIIEYPPDDNSKNLARNVQAELTKSLKGKLESKIIEADSADFNLQPRIRLSAGEKAIVWSGGPIDEDIFKQKIACAVFDGLKKFFNETY